MPFTAAHPAIVLPFMRVFGRFRAASALVIGSMVPDLVYFVPWLRSGYGSHSLMGLVTFCLPVGLALVIGFEVVLRKPLTFLLPPAIRSRLTASPPPESSSGLHTAVAVVIALLLGAFTHIAWDLIETPSGAVLRRAPWALSNLITIGGYRLYAYRLLQHCGTILGLAAIGWVVHRWYGAQPVPASTVSELRDRSFRVASLLTIVVIATAVGIFGGARSDLPPEWLQWIRYFLHRAVVWGGRGGGVAIGVYSAIWWVRQRHGMREVRSHARVSSLPFV